MHVVYTLPPPPLPNENKRGTIASSDNNGNDGGTAPPPRPRHGLFLLDGPKVVDSKLEMSDVPFHILCPLDRSSVGQSIHKHCCTSTSSTSYRNNALAVVCDMSPSDTHKNGPKCRRRRCYLRRTCHCIRWMHTILYRCTWQVRRGRWG